MEQQYHFGDEPKKTGAPQPDGRRNDQNTIIGILVVLFGIFLLLNNTNVIRGSFFRLLTSFPVFMILGGLLLGYRQNFRVGGWLFLSGAGVFAFLHKLHINVGQFVLPAILVGIGIQLLLKNRNKAAMNAQRQAYGPSNEDFINVDAIFSGADRIVQTPDFKGGSASSIFGGVKIDCKQANLEEDVTLNLTVFCGGVELIVPANWIVVNDATIILGGVEDKRRLVNLTGYEKKLILRGTILCGGIDIKSY